jgi:hypothetical protein
MSVAEESLTPSIVMVQDLPAIREQLKKCCVHLGTYFTLKSRSKPYIDAKIYEKYIHTMFLPHLNELGSLEEFAEENAILLMDNSLSHIGEVILILLRDARVRIITWPTHTTQIFSQLDVSLFDVLKRREQERLPFDKDNGIASFVFKTCQMLKQIVLEANIWGCF